MMSLPLIRMPQNDRSTPNALFEPPTGFNPDVTHWTLRPSGYVCEALEMSKGCMPQTRIQKPLNETSAGFLSAGGCAKVSLSARLRPINEAAVDAGKIPAHAEVDEKGFYRGLVNRKTKNPQFFLGDDTVVPSLLGAPKEDEYDLAVASQNVLDPTAAWWDNNVLASHTESRVNKLAHNYAARGLGL